MNSVVCVCGCVCLCVCVFVQMMKAVWGQGCGLKRKGPGVESGKAGPVEHSVVYRNGAHHSNPEDV